MSPDTRKAAPAHVLDNPVWASLTGPSGDFAEIGPGGLAARYFDDASPFAALADPEDPRAWADLAALAGPDAPVWVTGLLTPPEGWTTVVSVPGVQLDGAEVRAEAAPEAVRLGPADVPEMLELVELTKPGPFLTRTVELGTYLGVGDQRGLHPPGPPGPGPRGPADPCGGRGDQSPRRAPVPARGGGQHRRDSPLRVHGLHPPPPPVLHRPAHPGRTGLTRVGGEAPHGTPPPIGPVRDQASAVRAWAEGVEAAGETALEEGGEGALHEAVDQVGRDEHAEGHCGDQGPR